MSKTIFMAKIFFCKMFEILFISFFKKNEIEKFETNYCCRAKPCQIPFDFIHVLFRFSTLCVVALWCMIKMLHRANRSESMSEHRVSVA